MNGVLIEVLIGDTAYSWRFVASLQRAREIARTLTVRDLSPLYELFGWPDDRNAPIRTQLIEFVNSRPKQILEAKSA